MKFFNKAVLATIFPITLFATPAWDWQAIDTRMVSFPKKFLWGAGSAAHQVEGDCTNNSWADAEKNGRFQEVAGKACDHWNRYKEDIQLLKQAGLNSYRFSVEWSKIEPQEGVFDESALQHYQDVVNELLKNTITPFITLHHYTDPLWFAQKGGFEKQENIGLFVRFAKKVIDRLQPHGVKFWCTFNSTDGYAAKGYQQASQPPFKKDMALMAEVYKNVLEAHVRTYRLIKPLYKETISLGILKNIMQFDPYYSYNPFDHLVCKLATDLVDTSFYTFFTTGKFNVWVPFKVKCTYSNPLAIGSLDFVGLNYYSNLYIKFFRPVFGIGEKTQNPNYASYPEGLYRALHSLNKNLAQTLSIPIYVTENGIATDDDNQRDRFLRRSLYALSKALEEGLPINGYMYWSLLDSYEWGNYETHYGIYAVDRTTLSRTYKKGMDYLTACAQGIIY